ncbi:hypothetical protein C8R45DRAFT_1095549 [Mycena sanguinolenta]|nr:hypothetical protein C8R45DRAFT_1095549 [Mycena sanguinolenta]
MTAPSTTGDRVEDDITKPHYHLFDDRREWPPLHAAVVSGAADSALLGAGSRAEFCTWCGARGPHQPRYHVMVSSSRPSINPMARRSPPAALLSLDSSHPGLSGACLRVRRASVTLSSSLLPVRSSPRFFCFFVSRISAVVVATCTATSCSTAAFSATLVGLPTPHRPAFVQEPKQKDRSIEYTDRARRLPYIRESSPFLESSLHVWRVTLYMPHAVSGAANGLFSVLGPPAEFRTLCASPLLFLARRGSTHGKLAQCSIKILVLDSRLDSPLLACPASLSTNPAQVHIRVFAVASTHPVFLERDEDSHLNLLLPQCSPLHLHNLPPCRLLLGRAVLFLALASREDIIGLRTTSLPTCAAIESLRWSPLLPMFLPTLDISTVVPSPFHPHLPLLDSPYASTCLPASSLLSSGRLSSLDSRPKWRPRLALPTRLGSPRRDPIPHSLRLMTSSDSPPSHPQSPRPFDVRHHALTPLQSYTNRTRSPLFIFLVASIAAAARLASCVLVLQANTQLCTRSIDLDLNPRLRYVSAPLPSALLEPAESASWDPSIFPSKTQDVTHQDVRLGGVNSHPHLKYTPYPAGSPSSIRARDAFDTSPESSRLLSIYPPKLQRPSSPDIPMARTDSIRYIPTYLPPRPVVAPPLHTILVTTIDMPLTKSPTNFKRMYHYPPATPPTDM